MDEEQVVEGTATFTLSGFDLPCTTYYTVIGDLHSGNTPVVILHGGPGSGHEYLLPFGALWRRYRLPVILYDQVGCASSTHLREKAGDHTFWTVELFIQQLEALLDNFHLREGRPGFHLLGHSWGGMLAAYFASQQPRGLQRLILANAPASFDLYADSLRLNWKQLSQEAQQALHEATQKDDYTSQSFRKAESSLLKTFWCRADPFPPKELEARMRHQADDRTVFVSLYGPTLLQCTGSMHGWNCIQALPQITAETLVYNGECDMVREVAFAPFVKNIPRVREATIAKASHMSHLDNTETQEQVLELVGTFLVPSSDSHN